MTRVVAYETGEERGAARPGIERHLQAGGLMLYPTETVYGLGCALLPEPLEALASFKGRRPFLLLIGGASDVPDLRWTEDARRLAETFWPGPLTVALTAEPGRYPGQVMSRDGAVAVRVSSHPAVPGLLAAAGGPITSTSANRPGHPPARDATAASEVAADLPATDAGVVVLDGGRLPDGPPSTIVRCGTTNRLVREGPLSREELERVVNLA